MEHYIRKWWKWLRKNDVTIRADCSYHSSLWDVLLLSQILKSPHGRFDPRTLSAPAYSGVVSCVSGREVLSGISWSMTCTVISSNLPFFLPSLSVEKLQSLSDEEWTVFLLQLCSSLGEQNPSSHLSSSSSNTRPPSSTAIRSRLNLLCYLCSVVGHKVVANRLINSTLVGNYILHVKISFWLMEYIKPRCMICLI